MSLQKLQLVYFPIEGLLQNGGKECNDFRRIDLEERSCSTGSCKRKDSITTVLPRVSRPSPPPKGSDCDPVFDKDCRPKGSDCDPVFDDCRPKGSDCDPVFDDCRPKDSDCDPVFDDCRPKDSDCDPVFDDCRAKDPTLAQPGEFPHMCVIYRSVSSIVTV